MMFLLLNKRKHALHATQGVLGKIFAYKNISKVGMVFTCLFPFLPHERIIFIMIFIAAWKLKRVFAIYLLSLYPRKLDFEEEEGSFQKIVIKITENLFSL